MELVDVKKMNKFLQLTNQEDLEFVSHLLCSRWIKEEILKDYSRFMCVPDYKQQYSLSDYFEALYVECLMDCDFEYPILYEEFVHYLIWGESDIVKYERTDEFLELEKAIRQKRENNRQRKDTMLVQKFVGDLYTKLKRHGYPGGLNL